MDMNQGHTQPSGELAIAISRELGELRDRKAERRWKLKNLLRRRMKQDVQMAMMRFVGRLTQNVHIESALYLKVFDRATGAVKMDLGCVGRKVVTNAGAGYIVDAFQNLVELENMKYHGFGTGSTAEDVTDTALVAELTTQYVDNVRPEGTTTEGASANIFRSVATLSPDSGGTIAITEHGLFSAASGGVLLDRTVFSAVNLTAGADSLQATYELTITAGS